MSSSPISVIKRIDEFWSQNADPYLIQLPLIHSVLSLVASLLLACLIVKFCQFYVHRRINQKNPAVKKAAAKSAKSSDRCSAAAVASKKAPISDIRPLILIHNGFCFGFYGVGTLILFALTYFGRTLISCEPSLLLTEFHQHSIKHSLYTYAVMTFACFLDPLIRALGGKEIDDVLALVHQSVWSLLLTTHLVLNPIGITMSVVLIDGVYNVIRFGSAVLSIQHPDKSVHHKVDDAVRIVIFSILSAYSFHATSLIQETGCRPPVPGNDGYKTQIFFHIAVYAAIVCAVSVFRLASRFLPTAVIEKKSLPSERNLRKSVRQTKIAILPVAKRDSYSL